jgi:S-(hydroxymethyl)glutathione dehydrogenase/alcohol dehydrogenase
MCAPPLPSPPESRSKSSTVQLEGPKAFEVMVEIKATGICHTDDFTLSGADPEGLFPAILGHEGAGVVVEVGAGRDLASSRATTSSRSTRRNAGSARPASRKTNLCTAIRATQGQGLMPDGTSRFSFEGKPIHHYMGCSTFANFTVLPEIAVAKIAGRAVRQDLLHRLRRDHGRRRRDQHGQGRVGSKAIVFGLGGIGLNVIQGLRLAGADMIIGVDLNPTARNGASASA